MSDANAPEPAVPPTPPAQPAAAPAGPLAPESDRQLGMWAHIGGVIGFLPSLIIWLVFKDRGPVVAVEAKEAFNWQITVTIFYIAGWILNAIVTWIFWPLAVLTSLLVFAIWVLNVIWSIMGGVKVNGGGSYRYPINFRFIK